MIARERRAESLDRDPEVHSGDLVFPGTRVPVAALLDELQAGSDLDTALEGYPSVRPEHARIVNQVWGTIEVQAHRAADARARFRTHPDWAIVSAHVARNIDHGFLRFSDPPQGQEVLEAVKRVLDECLAPDETGLPGRPSSRCGDPDDARHEALRSLVEAATYLREAAELLDPFPSLHASHSRQLATRVDEVVADLRRAPPERTQCPRE